MIDSLEEYSAEFNERRRLVQLRRARAALAAPLVPSETDFKARLKAHAYPGEPRGNTRERLIAEASCIDLTDQAPMEAIDRFLSIYPLALATDAMWADPDLEQMPVFSKRRTRLDEIEEVLAYLVEPVTSAPLAPDTPNAAAEVNASSEGPKEYPEADAMADELEAARKRIAELEEKLAQAELPQPLPPDPTTKLSDYVPKEISDLMEPGETFTQARKRLSELLNVEKAELRLKRAAGSATEAELKREADVDRLQGLFSKLGEI